MLLGRVRSENEKGLFMLYADDQGRIISTEGQNLYCSLFLRIFQCGFIVANSQKHHHLPSLGSKKGLTLHFLFSIMSSCMTFSGLNIFNSGLKRVKTQTFIVIIIKKLVHDPAHSPDCPQDKGGTADIFLTICTVLYTIISQHHEDPLMIALSLQPDLYPCLSKYCIDGLSLFGNTVGLIRMEFLSFTHHIFMKLTTEDFFFARNINCYPWKFFLQVQEHNPIPYTYRIYTTA